MGIQINGFTDTVTTTTAGGTVKVTPASINATGVSTFSDIRITGGTIAGVSTAGITTAYIGSVNDGPISGARNRIINGDMRIDQRNAGAATANTINGYTVDRWVVNQATTGKLIAQQNAGSVTPPSGFTNYLGATSQSAYTPNASDYYQIQQAIEGYNLTDLDHGTANAKSSILSFWVRSSLTGTFGASIYKGGSIDRSYPFSYSIPTANTWIQITVSIAGDTSGTLDSATNGPGFFVRFGLGCGSTFTGGTANTWQSGNFVQPSGTVSVIATNGATFYITGVQLEPGTVATPFERRSYGQELSLCQRYFQQGQFQTGGTTTSGVGFYGQIFYQSEYRAAPTLVFSSVGAVGNFDTAVPAVASVNNTKQVSFFKTATATGSGIYSFAWTGNAEL